MSKDPAVLFYTSDFLTGTMTMSNENVGKYIRLLCLQHQKGRLTEQDMLYICTTYVREIFEKFVKDENGLFYNERLEEETMRRKKYSESRRNNISKRYEPTYVVHMETETENKTVSLIKTEKKMKDELLQEKFNSFWTKYPRKTGKSPCEKTFKKLNPDDELFNGIMTALENQIKFGMLDNGQYTPHPATWLNQQRWEDQIINKEKNNGIKGSITKGATGDELAGIAARRFLREQSERP